MSTPDSLQPFVDRLSLRSVLTEEERQAVLSLPFHALRINAKQDFVHLGEEAAYSCVIASGLVARFDQTSTGIRQITALHLPGDMADLHSAVRPMGVGGLSALCDTTILRVSHDAVRMAAARFPALAEAFWRDCLLDAAILMQWVVNVGRRDARGRLAHIVCEMAIRSGHGREPLMDYPFPITQEQLGDAAGITSVHVNRSLKVLRDSGLVTFRQGRTQIHDWTALVRIAEFDATYLLADTYPERQKRVLAM